jgi:acyl dehydratase
MRAIVGEKLEHTFSFSQQDVIDFARVTGDNNPVHIDESYAQTTIFKRPIMHGFLSGSVFSKVYGTLFPGQGSIYLSQQLNFKRPMFIDMEYKAIFEITDADPAKGTMIIQAKIFDSNGKVCLDGESKLLNKSVFSDL